MDRNFFELLMKDGTREKLVEKVDLKKINSYAKPVDAFKAIYGVSMDEGKLPKDYNMEKPEDMKNLLESKYGKFIKAAQDYYQGKVEATPEDLFGYVLNQMEAEGEKAEEKEIQAIAKACGLEAEFPAEKLEDIKKKAKETVESFKIEPVKAMTSEVTKESKEINEETIPAVGTEQKEKIVATFSDKDAAERASKDSKFSGKAYVKAQKGADGKEVFLVAMKEGIEETPKEETKESKIEENLSLQARQRMDGLAPKAYVDNLKRAVQAISIVFKDDGFEVDDIQDYINLLVNQAFGMKESKEVNEYVKKIAESIELEQLRSELTQLLAK